MFPVVKLIFGYTSDPKYLATLGGLILLAEVAINYLIINFVNCEFYIQYVCMHGRSLT